MVNRSLCRQRHDFPERAMTIDDSFFRAGSDIINTINHYGVLAHNNGHFDIK